MEEECNEGKASHGIVLIGFVDMHRDKRVWKKGRDAAG